MLARIVLILVPVTAAAFGQLILKMGMDQVGEVKLSDGLVRVMVETFSNKLVLGGLAFFAVNSILWLVVLSREKLSFVYPMVAFAYVVTVLLSKLVLHESVPPLRWAGLGVVILGILMIAKSSA